VVGANRCRRGRCGGEKEGDSRSSTRSGPLLQLQLQRDELLRGL
jgi:hypothetical protein